MGNPDRHPCDCDACDEWALGESTYCIMCTHHGCNYDGPSCPAMEGNPRWCDSCEEETETEYIHGQHLCDDCKWHEDANRSDYEDVECVWCDDRLSFPMVLDDGTRVEEATDLSLSKAQSLEQAYHPECAESRSTLERRKEENQKITDF